MIRSNVALVYALKPGHRKRKARSAMSSMSQFIDAAPTFRIFYQLPCDPKLLAVAGRSSHESPRTDKVYMTKSEKKGMVPALHYVRYFTI